MKRRPASRRIVRPTDWEVVMNELAPRPAMLPRVSPGWLAFGGVLALLATASPSPAEATRPLSVDVCAALGLCFGERVPGFGEAGRHGLPPGGTALAGARGRSQRSGAARRETRGRRRMEASP